MIRSESGRVPGVVGGEAVSESTAPQLKRALVALEKMQARLEAAERARTEPIAVVGVGVPVSGRGESGRVPGVAARGAGCDVGAAAGGPRSAGRAGRIPTGDREFDNDFFRVTPREAAAIDPQQRLLLEVAWEALEDAGIAPAALRGSRRACSSGRCAELPRARRGGRRRARRTRTRGGRGAERGPGRLSYLLGLHGPAVTVDTACSSSLVAVHLACQALRAGSASWRWRAG